MKMFRDLILAALICSVCSASFARAQDACDSGDIQAAIEQVASDNSCVAGGSYVSGQDLVDSLIELCVGKGLGKKCRRCLELGRNDLLSSLRTLVRLGGFSSEGLPAVKEAISAGRASCAPAANEPTPTPEPSATPGGGENENITQAVLHSIREACCSKDGAEFTSCRLATTQYGLSHGLSEGAANSILAASKAQLCN